MNKSDLRKQFKALLNRNDCTDVLADMFIDQAINRIQRTLRIPSMERSAELGFTDAMPDSFVLPHDFLDFIDLFYDNGIDAIKLSKTPRASFLREPRVGAYPRAYLRTGTAVEIRPTPTQGSTLSLIYYATAPSLDTDDASNWMTDMVPELVIYAALSFAGDYFVDDRKTAYEDVYTRISNELQEQAIDLEFSGADMAVQPAYPNAEY